MQEDWNPHEVLLRSMSFFQYEPGTQFERRRITCSSNSIDSNQGRTIRWTWLWQNDINTVDFRLKNEEMKSFHFSKLRRFQFRVDSSRPSLCDQSAISVPMEFEIAGENASLSPMTPIISMEFYQVNHFLYDFTEFSQIPKLRT